MNDRIIENEPGYEKSLTTKRGLEENEAYANIVRVGNISYAMIEHIKQPIKVFGSLIKEYFDFKSNELIEDVETWLNRHQNSSCLYTGLPSIHNQVWCSKLNENGYETLIKQNIQELKSLILK